MASKFPVALDDAATMPVVADNTDDVLAAHHNNQSDAIQAVETKVGTGASAPTDGKFLKGNGAGSSAWSTISASDIPDLSSTYAPAAKGVTNGDSHNHDGGDGAQIDHTKLTNIGTNTHAQIDTFIGTKAQASGLASLDGSSKVVQDPANATATPTQNKIPIADGVGGKLASGWIPDLSATYAAAAKGVTNGDTHDHSGGDGAQIDYTTLANKPTIPTNLDSLTDVTITTPSSGHVLKFNGSAWVNDADLTGAGGGNSVYIEEGGVAKANSSASDLTINLDGTDFDTSVVGNAVTVTVNNGGIDHTAIANIGTTSHANIDLALTRLANTSGTNTGDQTLPVKATGAEINTGTDDAKFATAKAIKDAGLPYTGKSTGAEVNTGTEDVKYLTPKSLKDATDSNSYILQKIYPVGSIYISTLSTNPATLLGFGTWSAFGAGKTLVGYDSGDADFNTSEKTGGEKTHTLTTAELASHDHATPHFVVSTSAPGYAAYEADIKVGTGATTAYLASAKTSTAGSGSAHNNLQPYIVTYMWKRTA